MLSLWPSISGIDSHSLLQLNRLNTHEIGHRFLRDTVDVHISDYVPFLICPVSGFTQLPAVYISWHYRELHTYRTRWKTDRQQSLHPGGVTLPISPCEI